MTITFRRILAFLADYCLIVTYGAALAGITLAVAAACDAPLEPPSALADKLRWQAVSIATLTLPCVCYFALCEASRRQGTIGKRCLKLRVIGPDGARLRRGRSFVRTAIKFAPWEIAHTAVWHVPGRPFVTEPGALNVAVWFVSLALVLWWIASLFVGGGRTPYDRVAGTSVIRAAPP